jgi:hypothetical protein
MYRSPPERAGEGWKQPCLAVDKQTLGAAARVSGVEHPAQLKVGGRIVIIALISQKRCDRNFAQAMIERRWGNARSTERFAAQLNEDGEQPGFARCRSWAGNKQSRRDLKAIKYPSVQRPKRSDESLVIGKEYMAPEQVPDQIKHVE